MSIESLQRVMWLLRKRFPNQDKILNNELRKAIMEECGTDGRTYKHNRKAMIVLGWIRTKKNKWIILTNKDITG